MAPSYPASSMQVLTSLLLLLNIAHVVALPNQIRHQQHQQHVHHIIDSRAPAPDTQSAHGLFNALSDQKGGKDFFKELEKFLREFDPIDILRTIIGGLMGFKESDDTFDTEPSSSSGPTTTVTVTATPTPVKSKSTKPVRSSKPVKTVKGTSKITVTKEVTATNTNVEVPESSAFTETTIPGLVSASATSLIDEETSTTAVPEPEQTSSTPPLETSESLSESVALPVPTESTELSGTIEASATANSTAQPEETFSILPVVPSGENISDNVTLPTPTGVMTSIPGLPTPVVTLPAESLDPLEGSTSETSASASVSVPLLTASSYSIPQLTFVNGTYVTPTPFATPSLSPPVFKTTVVAPAVSTITLGTPVIRPTGCPLSKTYFPNMTTCARDTGMVSSGSLILTYPTGVTPVLLPSPLNDTTSAKPTEPFVLSTGVSAEPTSTPIVSPPYPFSNTTVVSRPTVILSAGSLILTNPLTPTIAPVSSSEPINKTESAMSTPTTEYPYGTGVSETSTLAPSSLPPYSLFNSTEMPQPSVVSSTRQWILTNPLRPTSEVVSSLNATATTTIKVQTTNFVTVIVEPTPAANVSATSVVDLPLDKSSSSDAGFTTLSPPLSTGVEEVGTIPVVASTVNAGNFSIPLFTPSPTPIEDLVSSSDLVPTPAPATILSTPSSDDPLEVSSAPFLSTFVLPTLISTPRTLTPLPPFPTVSPASPTGTLPSGFPLPQPYINTTVLFPPAPRHLTAICAKNPSMKTITLPLLSRFYGPNAYPALHAYPGCSPANERQAALAPGLLDCASLGEEVQECQGKGKRILLGIRIDGPAAVDENTNWGGAAKKRDLPPDAYIGREGHPLVALANLTTVVVGGKSVPAPNLFDAMHNPVSLASTLFSLFSEGHAERADLRPLGPESPGQITWLAKPLGEEVVLDGFDVKIPGAWKGTPQAALIDSFADELRDLLKKAWDASGGKKGGVGDLGTDGPGVVVTGYI